MSPDDIVAGICPHPSTGDLCDECEQNAWDAAIADAEAHGYARGLRDAAGRCRTEASEWVTRKRALPPETVDAFRAVLLAVADAIEALSNATGAKEGK